MTSTTHTSWRRAGLRLAGLGSACALTLMLAGCGGDDTPNTTPTQGSAAPEGAGGAPVQTPIAACSVCLNTQLDCAP
jgi:hypothetical protein